MPDTSSQQAHHADDVFKRISNQNIRSIDLQFTDVAGMVKTVTIDADHLADALTEGVWFDGSAVEGFARIAESDMYLMPDLSTFAVIPWEGHHPEIGRTARILCDVYTPNGQPFAGDPRGALRRAMEQAAEMGLSYVVAPELEFYLFSAPPEQGELEQDDHASYFDASDGVARVIRKRITDALREMGIVVESSHHEVGSGQHELDFAPMDALRMADAILTARMAVRTIARQEGRFATFMPKPLSDAPGSGMHVHQWMRDLESDENRFADAREDYGLSRDGQAFLAGQLTHAREICAVLTPLVNSYRRLMSGLEAPIYVTWAQLNRGALLRVPRLSDDNRLGTRIESRCPDPSCNPYLAFTVLLHAGLRGIRDTLALPPAAEEELYEVSNRRRHLTTLPTSLQEALDEFEGSDVAREALGLHLFERFLEAKRLEWRDYLLVVSPWELERYLTIY
ncbi:glutamine synthetase family protein [Aggregatilinea lenta]|uniref:glutamine synthetase family protein n=1 Tax=Aggregatilinea lenta TaxID=913108 RepID=UPI000E5AFD41|nr:glutamine synthetase family protein [Aggregatilinea lenta]